ncbi:MAG: hypothetical protein CL820_11880 [Croceicoccus sp.]|nr:hypothetical protein [Croceicoccus sp.]MAL26570.1 hypothetical protein [Croceicoccus sp.]|tara:strand:- start:66777 stop:67424 length:648 start_codon:yes stop_codon:yes gene_type:complete
MVEMIQSNWLAFLLVVIVAVLIAIWLIARPKKPRDRMYRPDVLDEGVAPAQRNQAFIDAPPASAGRPLHEHEPPAAPEGVGGAGVAVAAAALMAEEEHEAREAEKHKNEDQMPADARDAQAVAAAVKMHSNDQDEGQSDDLLKIKGLGPKLAELLGSMGISRYDQIAAWSDADVQEMDARMGRFAGRINRDDWRTQARYLASGDKDGYEEKFGKL